MSFGRRIIAIMVIIAAIEKLSKKKVHEFISKKLSGIIIIMEGGFYEV